MLHSPAHTLLTPENLDLIRRIAAEGSFAAAARQLNVVPSALTYRVRQIEEALDVLLFDRRSRQAHLTDAGQVLLDDSESILNEIDALARRVKRVATGWEPVLTITIDTIINAEVVLDLCDSFHALNPPTQLRIREETLSGTLASVNSGLADLAVGVSAEVGTTGRLRGFPLGTMRFVFAVAPTHSLASACEPLSDDILQSVRAVAVADSVNQGKGQTVGLLGGQPVLTVPDMRSKLMAQVKGLGVGFLPEPLARPWIESGLLVEKRVERAERKAALQCVWRDAPKQTPGKALDWWIKALSKPAARRALLGNRQVPVR